MQNVKKSKFIVWKSWLKNVLIFNFFLDLGLLVKSSPFLGWDHTSGSEDLGLKISKQFPFFGLESVVEKQKSKFWSWYLGILIQKCQIIYVFGLEGLGTKN